NCQVRADEFGEVIDGRRNLLLVCGVDRQRRAPILLEIQEGSVDTNMVAKLGVLAPYHGIRVAEFSNAANHHRIDGCSGSDAEIREHLMHAIRKNGAQTRRLANIGAEHIRETWAQPIERSVAGGISER